MTYLIEADPKLGIHYMIDRDGTLRASVPEDEVANHVFHYSGQSIGIELINKAQIFRFLPKPVSAKDLRHQVAEALRRYAAYKQSATAKDAEVGAGAGVSRAPNLAQPA